MSTSRPALDDLIDEAVRRPVFEVTHLREPLEQGLDVETVLEEIRRARPRTRTASDR